MSTTQKFDEWCNRLKGLRKMAADNEALKMKDQNEAAYPGDPANVTDNRKKVNMPTNCSNLGQSDRPNENLHDATQIAGVGQGSYIVPENGTAQDENFTSYTQKLASIKASLDEAKAKHAEVTKQAQATQQVLATQDQQVKAAGNESFVIPAEFAQDASIMQKIAGVGAIMLSTEEGQRQVAQQMEYVTGVKEASAIIQSVADAMYQEQEKQASAETGIPAHHLHNINSLEYDFEKAAYAQGVDDAEAMAAAAEAGQDPDIAGTSQEITDEDVMGAIQMLVESGQIDAQTGEAYLQYLSQDGALGGELEQLGAELEAAVNAGDISAEDAQAIAMEIMEAVQGGMDPAAADPAAVDPAAAAPAM